MRKDEALLLDILIAARKIERFIEGMTFKQFLKKEMAQSAVIRELQVIGEAVRLISEETKAAHTGIDWQAAAGMRNRLIHEYFDIRLDVVWQTVQEDIPDLIERIEPLVPPDEDGG